MSWMKNLTLIAAGAAAGYLASRRQLSNTGTDVEVKPDSGTLDNFLSAESTMAQFFDSKYGKPFQKAALRSLKFMSDVKAGMNEKEAEIQQKLEEQKKDIRPGSLDTWSRRPDSTLQDHEPEVIEQTQLIEVESSADIHEQLRQNRLKRDKDLGEDFFTA